MTYHVRITPGAERAIAAHARYIAVDQQAPLNAVRWLQRIYDAAETLERWPRRCRLAEEDAHRPYEIRQYTVANGLLLFTVDDPTQTVWILGFRHGGMLPQPQNLP